MLLSSTRLSESPVWQLQKKAYARLGVESWAKDRVPFHITNNSRIASQYADILFSLCPKGPLSVMELGGGCGKFAFLLIGELLRRGKREVRYLLTDAAEKNQIYWQNHPLLKCSIDEGLLQTAVFDPLAEEAVPVDFVIANYFFDSIPHDAYRVEKGILLEGIVSLSADGQIDWDDPGLLPRLQEMYEFRPLEGDPYPDLPEATAVLEEYRKEGGSFLFPIGALRAIQRMEKSSYLLAADRGPCKKEEMQFVPSFHGSAFSFPVNFHAISRFVEYRDKRAFLSNRHAPDFAVALIAKQESPVFKAQVFGPLKREAKEFDGVLHRLEESNWDATLFFSFFDRLQEALPSKKEALLKGMRLISERFFPMFREEALLLDRLGLLFEELGEEAGTLFAEAARFKELPSLAPKPFLDSDPPTGIVLQIGEMGGAFEAIRSCHPKKQVKISWNHPIGELGSFDSVFLFPQKVKSKENKPSFVREIEEQFSLDTIVYSNEDIEAFFTTVKDQPDPKHVLHFFAELERKKSISREQLVTVGRRLGMEIPVEEEDRFFEILSECLKKHMKPGSVLRAFLPNVATYDDPRFFDEIVVDPYLEWEEKGEPRGLWITVRKL